MSKFIWASKRSKVKLQTLQLPIDTGGWSLPNFKYYGWAIQARILLDWIHKPKDALWVDVEQQFWNPVSLINLLDQKTQIPDKVKKKPHSSSELSKYGHRSEGLSSIIRVYLYIHTDG